MVRPVKGSVFAKRQAAPLKHKLNGHFKKSKKGKYNQRGFRLDGRFFHSESEANRYSQLKVMMATGKISRLECQVAYPVHLDGEPICTYYADFRYFIHDELGSVTDIVIEDVKGMRTVEFILKKKLVQAKHKVKIIELPASWMKHYDNKTALECVPIVAELEKLKKERASARREKRRLATKAMEMLEEGTPV